MQPGSTVSSLSTLYCWMLHHCNEERILCDASSSPFRDVAFETEQWPSCDVRRSFSCSAPRGKTYLSTSAQDRQAPREGCTSGPTGDRLTGRPRRTEVARRRQRRRPGGSTPRRPSRLPVGLRQWGPAERFMPRGSSYTSIDLAYLMCMSLERASG